MFAGALLLSLTTGSGWASPPEPGAGAARAALALAGTGAAALGALWFFEGGVPGAGDPGIALMGAGFTGLVGATAGAAIRASADGEGAFADRVSAPLISAGLSTWGSPFLGESDPATGTLALQPRIWLSDHLRLSPATSIQGLLGRRLQVETRPQGGLDPILATSGWGLDAAWELRWYPGDGTDRTTGLNQLELITGPAVSLRLEHLDYLQVGGRRALRRGQLVPLTLGARWNLSERQRYELVLGHRLDLLAWSDGVGGPWSSELAPGPLFLIARYDVQLPHPGPILGLDGRSRLRLSYTTSRFDGVGIDIGPVIGYLGPLTLSWDAELQPPGAQLALWLGLSATVAEDSTLALTLGLVPRRRGP